MNRVAKSLEALTRTGQARLITLIATAWIVVWGCIWGYSSYRTSSMDQWISAELDRSEKLIVEAAAQASGSSELDKRYLLRLIGGDIDTEMARRDATERWANRAKWWGPIGLAVISFSSLGGLWVYRGFRRPLADDR